MPSITIITIVVVALLTVIIFGLTWIGYTSCFRMYRLEVNQGLHDKTIHEEYSTKNKGGLVGVIFSYLALFILIGLFITGIVYKAKGEIFTIDNKTILVIKSGSMSDFYNENIAEEYGYNTSLQFDIGDICVFEKIASDTELVKGEVYGYKQKDIIITHRLVEIHEEGYEFRGDNNPVSDGYYINRDNIVLHYTGTKVRGIGAFILYAQSYFGIWSLLGIIGIFISSEIIFFKIDKINKDRYQYLLSLEAPEETKDDEQNTKEGDNEMEAIDEEQSVASDN